MDPSRRLGQAKKVSAYGMRIVRDPAYRRRVADLIQRQLQQATPVDAGSDAGGQRAAWLKGKRIYFVGGCELTYVKEHFEARGVATYHTFDHQRSSDPLAEVADPDSPLWTFRPDVVVLSQLQVAKGLFNKLQLQGPAAQREEQDADLDSVVGSLASAIDMTRSRLSMPIVVQSHPIGYRPAYGVLDQSVIEHGYSMAELIKRYELRLYEVAKERPSTYVADVSLVMAKHGYEKGLNWSLDLHGQHFTRAGGTWMAEHLEHMLYALDGETRKIKCAVFDLDDTLWGGILREDGPQGVVVRASQLRAIRYLMRRGILVALCSKNDDNVREHLSELLSAEVFDNLSAIYLNWEPKSQNLRAIAEELNIGLDALALFDDNVRERAEVAMNAPEVLVLTDADVIPSLTMPEFEVGPTITEDAASRAARYKQEAVRRKAQKTDYGADPDEFLRSLELELDLHPARPSELSRVAELLQRTNQLNATLRRTTLGDIEEAGRSGNVHVAHLRDRFGDYGLIGVAVTEPVDDSLRLVEFALSCRAMGRQVEPAMLEHLGAAARRDGRRQLEVDFVPTDRNEQMGKLLAEAGFVADGPVQVVSVDALKAEAPAWLRVYDGGSE